MTMMMTACDFEQQNNVRILHFKSHSRTTKPKQTIRVIDFNWSGNREKNDKLSSHGKCYDDGGTNTHVSHTDIVVGATLRVENKFYYKLKIGLPKMGNCPLSWDSTWRFFSLLLFSTTIFVTINFYCVCIEIFHRELIL